MTAAIDFYFDFSSPYGYFAACSIDEMAARRGCEVAWHPYLMGMALKATSRQPLVNVPMVNDYSRRDLDRCARLLGIEFALPEKFPVMSVAPCRAFYWLAGSDPDAARALALAIFRAYFVDGRDISDAAVVGEIAHAEGVDRAALAAGMPMQAVKDRVRDETDRAIARGVFGSPFFIVGDEPFWGHDRMQHLERWLETGGW